MTSIYAKSLEILRNQPVKAEDSSIDSHIVAVPHVSSADFVMCRKDGTYSDGRHPDSVEPGTVWDDLKRRDFTVNAMALDMQGLLYDPFGGEEDCKNRVLRFVGNPEDRLEEDGMRVLRALRFVVTHNLSMAGVTFNAVAGSTHMLKCVPVDRMRSELNKMFAHDTVYALDVLRRFPMFSYHLFRDGMKLEATLKGKGKRGKR